MGVGVIGTLMAGWSSANKFSLLGGMRVAAQLMAYELPFVLAAASRGDGGRHAVADRHRRGLAAVVAALAAASALVVFFVAGLAELQRPPFDMPVADSEIVFGPYTEYTGLRFALFLLAEYAGIVVLCALTTVLFLGGWHGPFAGHARLAVDAASRRSRVAFVVIWVRVAYPRLREDQLQRLAWQGLVPLALLQLAITGGGSGGDCSERSRSGLAKGLAVTLRHDDPRSVTAQYPDALPELPPRSRGVIALIEENCTVLHAVRPRVPGLVHLHRLAQGRRCRPPPRAAASADPQRARPVRDRLLALHVLLASASRSAPSTRCTGARSSSTPSSTSAT